MGLGRLRKYWASLFSRRKPQATFRREEAPIAPRVKQSLWFIVLGAFITSVTIASIPSRDVTTTASPEFVLVAPPRQAIFLGDSIEYVGVSVSSKEKNATETAHESGAPRHGQWRVLSVRRGESLSQILRREGFHNPDIFSAIHGNPDARVLYKLVPGETIRLRIDNHDRLKELVYRIDETDTLRLRDIGDGFSVSRETRKLETRLAYVSAVIQSSLYEDGREAGLSNALIMKLVEIFGWDIDFALDVQPGDSFSVIHEEKYWLGEKIADGSIIAAEFFSQKNHKEPFRAIAHREPKGLTQYYTPDGMSLRRAFLRTPVQFSRISSRFSYRRYHPVLKSWKAHRGVDYAAPAGTPVRATANGRVLALGWNGGYGKRIVIKHGGAYNTWYAHLSRFRRGLRAGSYLEQGQIIGYIGSTGLATGPHLHYEFRVAGVHRNPLSYRFPAATPIAPEEKAGFLSKAADWDARLRLISRNKLALNSDIK